MFLKATIFCCFILSASCMVLHQLPIPTIILRLQEKDVEPNYSFAYAVNDQTTGDIKSQSESRKGDAVFGQYSLVQPDGIKRVVDYKADDKNGFTAVVNNEGEAIEPVKNEKEDVVEEKPTVAPDAIKEFLDEQSRATPVSPTQQTVLISRSHYIQTIPNLPQPYIATILHRL